MKYYYNIPKSGDLWRNNLIYTSLISDDNKTFCMWYHNDSEYHKGYNQVVDQSLMDEKFHRELKFLSIMAAEYPALVPEILDVDLISRKIFLRIDGVDLWQRTLDHDCSFDQIVPDWQDQMLNIIKTHRSKGWYKFSMHPSSYFIVDGKLKSINYFFTYQENEPLISISDVESHIYSSRQDEIRKHIQTLGINWNEPQSFDLLNQLCWKSFSNMYPNEFIEKAKCIK